MREWVLVSPQRTERPWSGKVEKIAETEMPRYDPDCYLCPGNKRAGGKPNPRYEKTFAFDNDFPALVDAPFTGKSMGSEALLTAEPERGISRVGCFSPRHDVTLSRMTAEELAGVVELWIDETHSLEKSPWVRWVQIFENRGQLMGASNPHPHCQIWASGSLPNVPQRELGSFGEYQKTKQGCLLCDYVRLEMERNERIVCENGGFVALVPFWAVWPFETMILSRRHVAALVDITPEEKIQFGEVLKHLTTRYDNLFETSFPYTLGLHSRPSGPGDHRQWHFHTHIAPPLLRSAAVQKFMVGYELFATPQRDISPEEAAARLAALPEIHYLEQM